jgi:hypothetical protein
VKDKHGSWLPGPQFMTSNENNICINRALTIIKITVKKWSPRYFIIDDSGAEALGIERTFHWDDCVNIYLCKVHVIRSLMRKLGTYRDIYKLILKAMHKLTKIGFDSVYDEIMELPLVKTHKNLRIYLDNIRKTSKKWAMYARQHSLVLLQNTSTNAIESYHRQIKRKNTKTFGLKTAIENAIQVNREYYANAERFITLAKYKSISECVEYPEIKSFPYAVQLLLATEIKKAYKKIEKDEPLRIAENPLRCFCLFFRQYNLPCSHIFYRDIMVAESIFNDKAWNEFNIFHNEAGFDIYWTKETVLEFNDKKILPIPY